MPDDADLERGIGAHDSGFVIELGAITVGNHCLVEIKVDPVGDAPGKRTGIGGRRRR
jgi:hypothetical protein